MELSHLKEIAAKLNFEHHHNIGAEKLENQLREHCISLNTTLEEVASTLIVEVDKEDTPTTVDNERIKKLSSITFADAECTVNEKDSLQRSKEAFKLVRCTITSNNKNKVALRGEIFCARNAKISEIKKFVPFGVPTHVPQILFNIIQEKQYQTFRDEKVNGNTVTRTMLIPEYNIQILPPLTRDELEAIKQKQIAEGFNGE